MEKLAHPYTAKHCEDCDTWIYVDAAPFAEGDRTKTVRDFLHWDREHNTDPRDDDPICIGFPAMQWNSDPVIAILEDV